MKTLNLLFVMSLAACGSTKEPSQATPISSPATQNNTKNEAAKTEVTIAKGMAPGAPVVTLTEAGKEPRQELRYSFQSNQEFPMVMTMDMDMELPGQGTIYLPRMVARIQYRSGEQLDGEWQKFYWEILEFKGETREGVIPGVLEAVKGELAKVQGIKGTDEVSRRGFHRNATVDIPQGLDAQTQQMIEQMTEQMESMGMPFPQEAIGVGGKWTSVTNMKQNGIELASTTTHEVMELSANKVVVNSTVFAKAEPQTVQQNGITMDIKALSTQGNGGGTVSFTNPIPLSKLTADTNMQAAAGGQEISMKMRLVVDIASK